MFFDKKKMDEEQEEVTLDRGYPDCAMDGTVKRNKMMGCVYAGPDFFANAGALPGTPSTGVNLEEAAAAERMRISAVQPAMVMVYAGPDVMNGANTLRQALSNGGTTGTDAMNGANAQTGNVGNVGKKCPYCGMVFPEEAKFCFECGNVLVRI